MSEIKQEFDDRPLVGLPRGSSRPNYGQNVDPTTQQPQLTPPGAYAVPKKEDTRQWDK